MKNIFSLSILLTAFSLWAAAKNPAPQSSTETIQANLTSASSAMQVDALMGPNPTGVATIDQPTADVISVYPNPATTYVEVRLTAGNEGKVEVALYDVTGKLLKSTTETAVSDKAVRVTRDNLPAGVYFLLVKTAAGQQCRKVIFS